MESILRKDHPEGVLVYTDRLDDAVISEMKKSLRKRTYIGKTALNKSDTLTLSRSEIKYIDSVVSAFPKLFWTHSLFSHSERISRDSLWPRIDKQFKKSYDSLVKATTDFGRQIARREWIKNANTFQFATPIFLRNRTIFIFYYMRLCGSLCGVTDLSVYRLENGAYKRWIVISKGVF